MKKKSYKKKKSNIKTYLMALAIGILFALFVGFGISTFYESPKYNDYCSNTETNYEKCSNEYNQAREGYSRNVAIILLVFGIIAIVTGLLITSVSAVSGGLLLGGTITLIHSIVRYWSYMDKYFRFGTVTVLLVFLIILAYWKLRD